MRVYQVTTKQDAGRAYPCATESPPPFWSDGLPLSRQWFADNLGQCVEGLHLEDDAGNVIGHIYWAPSEQALVPYDIEPRVAFLYCEWVQQAHRGRGYMRQLFETFINMLQAEGYKGVLVDGTEFEGYMHHSHFAKRGFRVLREAGAFKLMYLPLTQETVRVEPVEVKIVPQKKTPVEVLIIGSLFCPVGASAVLAVRKIARELGDQVVLQEVPASREALARYGRADGIFINGKEKFMGPVTEDQVRQAILEELK